MNGNLSRGVYASWDLNCQILSRNVWFTFKTYGVNEERKQLEAIQSDLYTTFDLVKSLTRKEPNFINLYL